MIDTSSLAKALDTLDIALSAHAAAPADAFVRDACIQRFEYSYELAHKMLRRHLAATEQSSVQELSFPNLIRLAYRRGRLAESWDIWSIFRDARNATSHAYNEAKAVEVVKNIPAFAAAARFLLTQLDAQKP
jgi:nucleotidyltransferase substrate binding protein (TIGR01987 family)